MRLLLLIGIGALHLASLNAAVNDDTVIFVDDDPPINPISTGIYDPLGLTKGPLRLVTHSANIFSGKFVKVCKNFPGNLITCPISASTILSMITYGAQGKTERQLRNVLQLPSRLYDAKIGFQTLVDSFANYKQVQLLLANKIFFPSGLRPKTEFMKMTRKAFRSEAQIIDFQNSARSSKIINEWCEKATNHRIKNIITEDDLNSDTSLVLVNAVYFKGDWMTEFNAKSTLKRTFFVNDNEDKTVSTMFARGSYRFGKLPKFGARFVELPYKSEDSSHNISMFVILPVKRNGLASLEAQFDQIKVADLIRIGKNHTVELYLPKFKIESEFSLKEPLEGMGLTGLFENPNFTGIVDKPPLKITKIIQKAFIEIDEVGSEAAAATVAVISNRMGGSQPGIVKFRANHPFMAIIATTSNNPVDLFRLRYTGPENTE